ncbi:MAG TPA: sugar-binding protein [Balneolaceae bacterium]|nr:sugar-binding protein [Balneolaceae bacterium]
MTKAHFRFFIVLFLFLSPLKSLRAQEWQNSTNDTFQPLKINQDFDISAALANPLWLKAPSVPIRYELQPNDESLARVKTEVKVLYSDDYLYIGFIAHDPQPTEIRAHISDRDNAFNDDYVGIILDTFQSNRHAYELFVNPLGIQMDGMRTGNNEDMNFDLLWYSEGAVSDSGYTAVMKIPFKSLNFPDQKIQDWTVQFIRNYPRNSRHIFAWTNMDRDNPCLICQSGEMVNIRGIKSTNTVELLPYAMSYQSSSINNADDPSSGLNHGPLKARVGGSISYSPSSTMSLNAVFNPDFSQVESDAAQIGVNETFALFYSEKRPFFMKGATLFNTEENLFYSRMINRPLAAGKFTQKTGDYTLAFLTAYDRNAPFIIPGLYGSSLIKSDINAYSNVLRGKYNVGSQSFIGGLITTRNQNEAFNYVGSIDWNFKLADHYYFGGQAGFSTTKELENLALFNDQRTFGNSDFDAAFNGEQYNGTLVTAELSREAEYYNFEFGYTSFSPTFQTQSGFINNVDQRQFEWSQSISYYPSTQWLSNGSFSVSGNWIYDFSGRFMERFMFLRLSNDLAGQTHVSISYLPLNDERFRGGYFTHMNRIMFDVNSKALDALTVDVHYETGRYVYRTANPVMGHGYSYSISATVQPTSQFEFSLDYNYATLSSLDDLQTFYGGDIIRLNSQFNFSRKLFARFIAQYDSFSDQLQLYPLLYYKLNPFTKFYIGMTDNLNRYNSPVYDGFKEVQRQFFVKFQYLIRS